jgi:tRNA(fMet)-specific endonuclease VapC
MIEYMLDSDIAIYVMTDRAPSARRRFEENEGRLCISAVGLGELMTGVEKSRYREQNVITLQAFVARLVVLPFGELAAAHYGQIRAALERAGTPCGAHDMQIGAHARSEGLVLITNNRREFDRMPGLRVENWV